MSFLPVSQEYKIQQAPCPGSPAGPGGLGRAQQREGCLYWSPGPHVFHSSLRAVSSPLSFSPYNVTVSSVNTATADKTINSVHKDYSAFQQGTENRSVSQSRAFGPSQECSLQTKKRKERGQFYFLRAEKSWLLEKGSEHHFPLLLTPPATFHPGEAFPRGYGLEDWMT